MALVNTMMIRKGLVLSLLVGIAASAKAAEVPKGEAKPGSTTPSASAPAQGEKKKDANEAAPAEPAKKKDSKEAPPPKVTRGQVTLGGGKVLQYKAEAGVLRLENEQEEPQASIFYVAYEVQPEAGKERPVMFCFNGGPGSSAVWLHLGVLGPRRVDFPQDGLVAPPPPYRVVENAETLLGASDLVFVDPVSTGYSRATQEKEAKQFHGYAKDIESVSEFIRRWVTDKGRWGSPKYLIGESYGAIRVTGVAEHLQSKSGMYLNGVVLLSGLLDFATLREAKGNDLPSLAFLPSYATVAHYFGKLDGDLQKRSREEVAKMAREFALGAYANALLQGNRLGAAARQDMAGQVARFTGLGREIVERSNLRVDSSLFRKQLFWREKEMIGRFDARVKGPDPDPTEIRPEGDRSLDLAMGVFSGAMKDYLRRELQYESKLSYEILSSRVQPWNYEPFENRYLNVADSLERAMLQNEHLRLLILCGYEDLATPFLGIEQSVAQLNLPEAQRNGIRFAYYEGGHMMYNLPQSRIAVACDLQEFVGRK